MTMKRTEKASHEMILKGQKPAPEFQSPKLRTAAKASRGSAQMTPAEYATYYMGREHGRVSPSIIREGKAAEQIKARRSAGRSRKG